MKNKQKNGQVFGPKMAKALKARCDRLEDVVLAQQSVIEERESEIVNLKLSTQIANKRYADAMTYLELNRPEILQLMKTNAKHGALAAAGKVPSVTVKLVKRKLKAPVIPEVDLPFTAEEAPAASIPAFVQALRGPQGYPEVWDPKTRKFVPVKP